MSSSIAAAPVVDKGLVDFAEQRLCEEEKKIERLA